MELWKEEFTLQSAFSYSAFLLKVSLIMKGRFHYKALAIVVTLHKLWTREPFRVISSQRGSGALSISEDARVF